MFHFVKKIAYEKKINDLLRLKKKEKKKKDWFDYASEYNKPIALL